MTPVLAYDGNTNLKLKNATQNDVSLNACRRCDFIGSIGGLTLGPNDGVTLRPNDDVTSAK